eukprot:2962806-Pyramimonas_sp.AAC.1
MCTFESSQIGSQSTLASVQRELGIDGTRGTWAGIGVWGDSAPCAARDSLYLCLWNVVSGPEHR